ncbi:MAG: PAS domain S-box protein, partial [Smithella sp.]
MKKKINKAQKMKTGSRSAGSRNKLIEALKRQNEEKYLSILETIEDGYYEIDLAGNITFFNDALCRIHGRSAEELTGLNYRQYLDKENIKKVFQAFKKVYKTGESRKGLFLPVTRKDGAEIYVEVSIFLQKDSSGKPAGFRGIIRNITERRNAEE